MKKVFIFKSLIIVSVFMELGIAIYNGIYKKGDLIIDLIIFSILAICQLLGFFGLEKTLKTEKENIKNEISSNINGIIAAGNVGILFYDANKTITWSSEMFKERGINHTGEKITNWLPKLDNIVKSSSGSEIVGINDKYYRVTNKENEGVLFFKDITNEFNVTKKLRDNSYVIGLLSYDNYDEASETDDDISEITSNIKVPVVEYFKKFGIDYKTLRNNKLLLILNSLQYNQLLEDRFSILDTVRNESKKSDLNITLSIAFARGSDNFIELDDLAFDLLNIAETRGGDQVVSRNVGGEVEFFGGHSEAKEKRSKVKVRAVAQSLKNLIVSSSNVIIAGHLDADADSVGSSICMSSIAKGLGKDAYIIYNGSSTEPMIRGVIESYKDDLSAKHNFVSEEEAYDLLDNNSLVIMVDHHTPVQSSGKSLLEKAKNIVIIDHHRRNADLEVKPLLLYVEAGSSSTTELINEFIPYILRHANINAKEANIMYLGIIIDTNHFRSRTGSRTFEVCKSLREYGADPSLCEQLLQDSFENIKKEAEIINSATKYTDRILISVLEEGYYSRTIASMSCDSMIRTKNIDAAFVICQTEDGDAIITARSNGNVNVQIIMEAMQGGGHLTAAGLQRKNEKVLNIKKELIDVLDEKLKEETK